MKRCLLITPLSFYSWHVTMSQELVSRGYSVDVMNDEYPEGVFGLLFGVFFNSVSQKITLKKFKEYFNQHPQQYDLVIIFKGRGISTKLIELLKIHAKRVVGYNFDSFQYFANPLAWYHKADAYKTFDFMDSAEYDIPRVDLFSDISDSQRDEKVYDISCVMKNHSDRLVYLDTVYRALHETCTFKIYIYEKNFLTLINNMLKHPLLVYKWRKYISFTSLNQNGFASIMRASKFTLDYAHPKQTGITMRCFQAAASGTKIITNNKYIANIDYFHHENWFVFDNSDSVEGLKTFVQENMQALPIYVNRSIADFMDDLLQ